MLKHFRLRFVKTGIFVVCAAVTLTAAVIGANAVYCKRHYGIFSSYFYCSDYCCGDSCCYYSYYWGGGRIAGAVIGGIIGLCILVALIILLVKTCCIRSGTRGRTIQTGQGAQPNVFVMTAGTTQTAYPATHAVLSTPYPGTGAGYPPPYTQPGFQEKTF